MISGSLQDFIVEIFQWAYGIAALFILCEIPLRIYIRVAGGRSEVFR